ncbi:hypothetical protein PYW07_017513 [Mythimna separata]|uniref:Uncharacterized protein n=1 Tax=Mythimna separata TaxID=271217 RepID=A0AAD8DJJ2_MYTSE|nr:hypothetical protein PYW07_017513 [Mythimna separata]
MDQNFTDFTRNDSFMTWTCGDISSSTDRVPAPAPPPPRRAPPPKRTHYDTYYGEPPAKRPAPSIRVGAGFKWNLQTLAAAADAVESGGKSPVSALNELGVRVAYSVLRQGGPAHCPSFHVAVTRVRLAFALNVFGGK